MVIPGVDVPSVARFLQYLGGVRLRNDVEDGSRARAVASRGVFSGDVGATLSQEILVKCTDFFSCFVGFRPREFVP